MTWQDFVMNFGESLMVCLSRVACVLLLIAKPLELMTLWCRRGWP
jgi:hypothetical protein